MTNEEVISLIEETLEIESSTLNSETLLDDILEFDSMGKLSVIVMADDEFDKKLTGEQMKKFKTVGDIVMFLNA
ncbi:MAG: acyl carrier protein [Saprospiraceae bacterium]|nr:acyl carrier protein [Saprospiraceae bacterium]MBK8819926.1 acyl carrier protein [Saprospiraceae bacterium]